METVVLEGVPIATTGTYALESGEATFSEEDLASAVAALDDPAVQVPRVKINGLAASFDAEAHGGEPAMGRVENMRVSGDGQTLLGDLVVPTWLAAAMEVAYPARSVEGFQNFTTATGRHHDLVVTAVALLGVDVPGIATLDDLRELLSENGPAPDAEPVLARLGPRAVAAGLDQDLVRRRFYDVLQAGEVQAPAGAGPPQWWWIRSLRFEDDGSPVLIVDDDEGNLLRVTVTVSGDEVAFGDPELVVEQYVAAGAASTPPAPLAEWRDRADSRRVAAESGGGGRTSPAASARRTETPREERDTVNPEQMRLLRERLGLSEDQLPDDATDEQVTAALSAEVPPEEGGEGGSEEQPAEGEESGGSEGGEETEPAPEAEPEAVAAGSRRHPDGTVLMDAEEVARLRAGADAGVRADRRHREEDRDRVLATARDEGRFPPSRLDHWRTAWDGDPEGVRHLLTASAEDGGLAPGLVPVDERGGEPHEGDLTDNAYDVSWLNPAERQRIEAARNGGGDPRVRIVKEGR